MPYARGGKKAAVAAVAGIRPSETRYIGLLIDPNQPNARTDEASAAGYARQQVVYDEGTSPQYRATQTASPGGDVDFDFTATSANVRGFFLTKGSAPEASDTDFLENMQAYVLGANIDSLGDGSTVTVTASEVRPD